MVFPIRRNVRRLKWWFTLTLIFSVFLALTPTQAAIPDGYYNNAAGKTGSELKTALYNIVKGHTEISYDAAYDALEVTDRDPNNANNVILIYSGWSRNAALQYDGGNGWNREHVWAKSHGDFGITNGAGTDIHHLRPADVSTNSARNNKDFDNGGTQYIDNDDGPTDCYSDSDSWEARSAVKGDVARMIFYMATRYEGDGDEPDLELVDLVNSVDLNTTGHGYHGKLSTLLEWHANDPVDDWERNRNDIIYTNYQHNRNPFIDHPEYVALIDWTVSEGSSESNTGSKNIWINEFHYDNDGIDTNEFVEIFVGNGYTSLSNITLTLYNGNGGGAYETYTLNGFTTNGTDYDGFKIYYKDIAGIQNGSPDGLAIDTSGTLIQFLSYEGTITATDGVANGTNSTDIGVSETTTTPVGQSLQLVGSGHQYSDFSWSGPATDTKGLPNSAGGTDQSLPVELSTFWAISGDRQVTLEWSTESETENLGFNLYRSINSKPFSMINGQLIPGHGSTSERHEYSYIDYNVFNSATYNYKIEDVDYSGKTELHNIVISATPTGKEKKTIADGFHVQPCFPNPFNPETTLRFEIGKAAIVHVQVYDLLGNSVTTLTNSTYQPGEYSLIWNGRDAQNRSSASGIYLVHTQSSTGFSHTDKVIFIR